MAGVALAETTPHARSQLHSRENVMCPNVHGIDMVPALVAELKRTPLCTHQSTRRKHATTNSNSNSQHRADDDRPLGMH
eukprot:3887507-Prymnesium_polylepis.1